MPGEIQVNSVTALTESGSNIVLNNVDTATNRTNLGLGSIATQAADSVAITGGTIGSSVVFPAGHVIQFKTLVISDSDIGISTSTFAGISATDISITRNSGTYLIYSLTGGAVDTATSGRVHYQTLKRTEGSSFSGTETYIGNSTNGNASYKSDADILNVPNSFRVLDTESVSGTYTYRMFMKSTEFTTSISKSGYGDLLVSVIEFNPTT